MEIQVNGLTLEVTAPCQVKVYDVPTDYSEDGKYVACWNPGTEYEPYPACLGSDSHLVAHVVVNREGSVINLMEVK